MDEFSSATDPAPLKTVSELSFAGDSSRPANRDTELGIAELIRIKLARTQLLWLMLFLAVLLFISYIVPYVIEETQYAARRGRMRADHELAREELKGAPLAQFSRASQLITQKVTPSVVHISARSGMLDVGPAVLGMRSAPFSSPPPGQGSGVIVDGDRGYVITNYHVIKEAWEIKVRLAEGKPLTAHLIGHDMDSDLAVLQIRREEMPNRGLVSAEWGDSQALEVGSLVWALGSPYGLEQTVTSGIISAKHRAGKVGHPLQDFLQTDAAVNPGNSGGPLVDTQGRVVGINTAIVGENYQGISFAVPSQVARQVYERILADEEHAVRRGYLGVWPVEVTEERALAAGLDSPRGVFVYEVVPDSPAAKLRLQAGDIILSWNGTAIKDPAQLTRIICDTSIDSQATLVIWRGGSEQELQLQVGERPRTPAAASDLLRK